MPKLGEAYKKKIKLNPHVEPHGNHTIEWSYHFPLESSCIIEAKLDIFFPNEKVTNSARSLLTHSILPITRLSLADSAQEVRHYSSKLLKDILWLTNEININQSFYTLEKITKYFCNKAKNYWSPSFFSKVGLLLQSDFKYYTNKMIDILNTIDIKEKDNWHSYYKYKRHLCSILRSSNRLINIFIIWKNFKIVDLDNNNYEAFNILENQMKDLAELSLVLMCKVIAELQESCFKSIKLCEETLKLIHENNNNTEQENIEDLLKILIKEKKFLISWSSIIIKLRTKCNLLPLVEVATNSETAAKYFERVLLLKRSYYQAWDLKFELHTNDSKVDLIIGAIAALISAFFATLSTALITIWFFDRGITTQTKSLIAILLFVIANVIIYVLKDRMKEWIKIHMKKNSYLKSGILSGICTFKDPDMSEKTLLEHYKPEVNFSNNIVNNITNNLLNIENKNKNILIANIERQYAWKKINDTWCFSILEKYNICETIENIKASIVKQIWRLPLDEILNCLDDSKHMIKLPTLDGIPQEVAVLKRILFPFKVKILVKTSNNTILDQALLEGNILIYGAKISSII